MPHEAPRRRNCSRLLWIRNLASTKRFNLKLVLPNLSVGSKCELVLKLESSTGLYVPRVVFRNQVIGLLPLGDATTIRLLRNDGRKVYAEVISITKEPGEKHQIQLALKSY